MASRAFASLARSAGRLTAQRRPAPSAFYASASARPFSTEELVPGIGKGKTSTGLLTAEDGKRQDQIQKFIAKNEALLQRLGESDIPADAPYRINLALVAKYR